MAGRGGQRGVPGAHDGCAGVEEEGLGCHRGDVLAVHEDAVGNVLVRVGHEQCHHSAHACDDEVREAPQLGPRAVEPIHHECSVGSVHRQREGKPVLHPDLNITGRVFLPKVFLVWALPRGSPDGQRVVKASEYKRSVEVVERVLGILGGL